MDSPQIGQTAQNTYLSFINKVVHIESFQVSITILYNNYNFFISCQPIDKKEEHFIVMRAGRKWIFTSNRPFYRAKGLRHRMDLKLVEGKYSNITFIEKLVEAIQSRVRLVELAQ